MEGIVLMFGLALVGLAEVVWDYYFLVLLCTIIITRKDVLYDDLSVLVPVLKFTG